VILLDEIEKAHPEVWDIFLQLFDEGRLTDSHGRLADGRNAIFIMTSNIGSHLIQENFENLTEANRDEVLAKTKNQVYEQLKKTIRPEFLNRIDEVIMFEPLTRENMNKIVEIQLNYVIKSLADQEIHMTVTEEAIDWLSQLGFDPQFGARPVKRVIQKQVLNELSKEILAGKIKKEQHIKLDMFENKLVFVN
jgi:ATP-dependent Clp protease ATP-binding subunit ClpB